MLLKMQRFLIIEHYLHSHYQMKMSNTFTFNRTELVPICQNKPWNFYVNFSMTYSFPLGYGPTKPGPNPISSSLLLPLDFFLWGHLKNKIFTTPLATIEELKRCITMEIQNITQKMLRKVFPNMMRRTVMCKNLNGVYFQRML